MAHDKLQKIIQTALPPPIPPTTIEILITIYYFPQIQATELMFCFFLLQACDLMKSKKYFLALIDIIKKMTIEASIPPIKIIRSEKFII